jgi:uncharacterized protein YjbI with pentapeptide repeats
MSDDHSKEEAREPTIKTEGFEELQARKLSQAGLNFIYTVVTNDNSKARDEQQPSWTRRIILIIVVSGVLAVLAALAWPTIEEPLGLDAVKLSQFWVAIIVAATFSITCFLVYFVAKKSLWDFLDLLIVPLALAIIGFGFAAQQQARQTQIENQRDERAQAVEDQRAQNVALQAYLDQMNHLMLEEGLLGSKEGETVFTLAKARTTTALAQLGGEHNQAVTRFLSESGLLREPALLAKADLPDAKLHKAVLEEAYLGDTNLRGANLTDAVLVHADFSAKEKVGGGTQTITADLPKADLSRATLLGADLSECLLKEATLTDATLQSADLRGADLQGADLSHAALQRADLSPATVPGYPPGLLPKEPTNLTDADLSHAALQEANLSSAVLQNATLTNADLTKTNLRDAYLSDADLSEATGWTMEQVTAARSLKGATMPNGQKYEDWIKSSRLGGGKDRRRF